VLQETKTAAFWGVAPHCLMDTDRRFRGAYCLHLPEGILGLRHIFGCISQYPSLATCPPISVSFPQSPNSIVRALHLADLQASAAALSKHIQKVSSLEVHRFAALRCSWFSSVSSREFLAVPLSEQQLLHSTPLTPHSRSSGLIRGSCDLCNRKKHPPPFSNTFENVTSSQLTWH
jgi:hypothetical protein